MAEAPGTVSTRIGWPRSGMFSTKLVKNGGFGTAL
jgi:hypothetical protein